MKTYTNLYPEIYAWENLERAYYKARRGKRSKLPAANFEYQWERNLLQLQRELADQSFIIDSDR